MTDQPLYDFIDMEAYDVVPGPQHRKLKVELERVKAELEQERKWIENAATVNRSLNARLNKAPAALREILTMIEDANCPYERLDIGARARAAISEIEGEA
jgi:hypothetical protein